MSTALDDDTVTKIWVHSLIGCLPYIYIYILLFTYLCCSYIFLIGFFSFGLGTRRKGLVASVADCTSANLVHLTSISNGNPIATAYQPFSGVLFLLILFFRENRRCSRLIKEGKNRRGVFKCAWCAVCFWRLRGSSNELFHIPIDISLY